MVALYAGVFGHRLELVGDLFFCRDQHVVLVDYGASEARVEVHDEGGKVRGFPFNQWKAPFYDIMNNRSPVYRSDSG